MGWFVLILSIRRKDWLPLLCIYAYICMFRENSRRKYNKILKVVIARAWNCSYFLLLLPVFSIINVPSLLYQRSQSRFLELPQSSVAFSLPLPYVYTHLCVHIRPSLLPSKTRDKGRLSFCVLTASHYVLTMRNM